MWVVCNVYEGKVVIVYFWCVNGVVGNDGVCIVVVIRLYFEFILMNILCFGDLNIYGILFVDGKCFVVDECWFSLLGIKLGVGY